MKSAKSHIVLCAAAFYMWLPLASHAEISGLSHLPPTTPLTHAIRLERFDEARTHITKEWINAPDRGQYHPLTYAAYTTNNDLMKALLEAGADPNRIEANGKTALYVTANMANVDGLELLKQHGAITPPQEALSPAVATIHSSCLESLKALIRLFPDTDLNRGWENRSKGGWLVVDAPGDPVAYAAYHGYDDMARFLLEKGTRVVGLDSLGQNALHHAAINSDCTAELVALLVEQGCPPHGNSFGRTQWRPHMDLGPRTPLDYAALAGSLEKVRAMAPALDPTKHRNAIRNAAQIASAYRQDDMARILFGLLQERIPPYEAFIHHTEAASDAQEPPNDPPAIGPLELKRIMPRTIARKGEIPQEGSIAIISDSKLLDHSAILTSNLSGRDGIQVIERDQIDAIIAEQGLRGFTNADSPQIHRTLDLIPARHVIFMTHHEYEEKTFARISLIHAASGVVSATHALPQDVIAEPEALGQLGDSIIHAIGNDADFGTGISIAVITPGSLESETASIARNLNTLLPHMAGNTRGFASLSRDQLEYLQKENAIGAGDSFWAAAWVIDGGITAVQDQRAELSLRAIHAIDGTEVIAKRVLATRQIDEGLRQCWNDLIVQMSRDADAAIAAAIDRASLEKEADLLQRHAKWLFEAGDYQGAGQLMQACLSLAKPTGDGLNLALMSHLKIIFRMAGKRYQTRTNQMTWSGMPSPEPGNYGRMGGYAENYQINPRATSHSLRMELLNAADHYIRLAEIAEAKIASRPRQRKVNGWTSHAEYDLRIEVTLTPLVSNALYELQYFATVIDHSMLLVDEDHQRLLRDLNSRIERITTHYLDYLDEHQKLDATVNGRMKVYTIEYLLRRDADYYARCLPDLLDRMLRMAGDTLEVRSAVSTFELEKLYQLACAKTLGTRELGLAHASESWDQLRRIVQDEGIKRNASLVSTAPLYMASTRAGRMDWLRLICSQPYIYSDTFASRSGIAYHPIGDLIGLDEKLLEKATSAMVESALLAEINELDNTSEFLRIAPLYRAIRSLLLMSESRLASFLQRRPEIATEASNQNPPVKWSQEAWLAIRNTLTESRNLNPETLKLLDQLSGKPISENQEEALLDLASSEVLVLPVQPGQPHRVLHTIPQRATLADNELWIPGFSIAKRLPWSEGETDSDNVIQVVSLNDKSVRTVVLPRLTTKHPHFGDFLGCSACHSSQGRVAVAKDFAYHTPDGRYLYYIRKDNHEVGEIKIPAGFTNLQLHVAAAHPNRNFLLVIASDRSHKDQLRQVLLIKDKKVASILVSNRRNPGQSPLDRADFNIRSMEFNGDSAWIGDAKKQVAQAYDLDSGEWSELPHSRTNSMISRVYLKTGFEHVESLHEQLFARFNASPRGFKAGFWHSRARYGSNTLSLPRRDIFMEHMLDDIRVEIPPVDHQVFQETWFPKGLIKGQDPTGTSQLWPKDPLRNYKGWWISPNEAIRDGHYKVVVICKWKAYYLVGVVCVNLDDQSQPLPGHRHEYGTQAVWLVPESVFDAARKPLRERYSRLIDFYSAWKPQQWKNAADLEFRNQKQDFWIAEQRPVQMHGGDSVFVIRLNHKNEARHLVMQIARSHRGHKIHFIIEVGDDENPTVLFDSMNHEISTSAEYRSSENFHIPLPIGTPEIRLINHSPRDHALRINKILLMP